MLVEEVQTLARGTQEGGWWQTTLMEGGLDDGDGRGIVMP